MHVDSVEQRPDGIDRPQGAGYGSSQGSQAGAALAAAKKTAAMARPKYFIVVIRCLPSYKELMRAKCVEGFSRWQQSWPAVNNESLDRSGCWKAMITETVGTRKTEAVQIVRCSYNLARGSGENPLSTMGMAMGILPISGY